MSVGSLVKAQPEKQLWGTKLPFNEKIKRIDTVNLDSIIDIKLTYKINEIINYINKLSL